MAQTVGLYEKLCGNKICNVDQFCSNIHQQCENCSIICGGTHNFDRDKCLRECQDYLFDMRYATSIDIQLIRNQQTTLFIIIGLVVALFLLVYGTQLYRWLRRRKCLLSWACFQKLKLKKQNQKSAEANQTTAVVTVKPGDVLENPHTESPKFRPKLNLHGNSSVHGNPSIYSTTSSLQTAITPISGRLPAEDTTLDFSYDNGGLILTPPISDRFHGPETTF